MSTNGQWRSLSTMELPYKTQKRIGMLLNAPHSKNWKDVLAMMPEYSILQMHQLARLPNPTMELLKHMNSTGRRVGELYDFAKELEMKRVCELIFEGLKERGHSLSDDLSNIKQSGDSPPSPKPPRSPTAVEEVYRRYHLHGNSTTPNGEMLFENNCWPTAANCPPSTVYQAPITPCPPSTVCQAPITPCPPSTVCQAPITPCPPSTVCQAPITPCLPSTVCQAPITPCPPSTVCQAPITPCPPIISPSTAHNSATSTNSSIIPIPSAPPQLSMPTHQITSISHSHLLRAIGPLDDTPLQDGGRKLGQGGFGTVYYCQLQLDTRPTEVAVKIFSENFSDEVKQQFDRELQMLSRISHPNMVPLLGYSNDGGSLCLIYPYMPLGSLDYHLPNRDLGAAQRTTISRDIANGLHYLHTGYNEILVHRDVKSANILLDSSWHAKLTDFGVARNIEYGSSTVYTQTIIGTRVYMAPEYCTGVVSPAVDVYSFGVVLYELLCGCLAQDGPPGSTDDLLTYLLDYEVSDIVLPCWSSKEITAFDKLGRMCTSNNRHTRPKMEKILQSLCEQSTS